MFILNMLRTILTDILHYFDGNLYFIVGIYMNSLTDVTQPPGARVRAVYLLGRHRDQRGLSGVDDLQ
jgi:hypothetical protein